MSCYICNKTVASNYTYTFNIKNKNIECELNICDNCRKEIIDYALSNPEKTFFLKEKLIPWELVQVLWMQQLADNDWAIPHDEPVELFSAR